jgi:hypothetical protein
MACSRYDMVAGADGFVIAAFCAFSVAGRMGLVDRRRPATHEFLFLCRVETLKVASIVLIGSLQDSNHGIGSGHSRNHCDWTAARAMQPKVTP